MSDPEDTALSLAGKAYDAALDRQKWPLFMEEFVRAVGGCSAILRSVDVQNHKAAFVASVGCDSAWQAACSNHFVKLDYQSTTLSQCKLGVIKASDQVFSLFDQRRTEYYNDYCLAQGKLHVLGGVLARDGGHTLLFAAQRGKCAGAFGEEDMRLMNLLTPHVTRAIQVHRKLSIINVEKGWALGVLNQLRMGVILTDSLGTPLFINHAAAQMQAHGKGISVCQNRLVLCNPSETALLHKLIAVAAHGAAGGDLRIALPNRIEFLHCLITPVSPDFAAHWEVSAGSGCVAVFLTKPGSLQLQPKRLAILYGLSPAESRLAAKLAELNSLEQAANELGVAMGTARSQLAAVFIKTGVKGQAELLMLLATGTLAYCRDA